MSLSTVQYLALPHPTKLAVFLLFIPGLVDCYLAHLISDAESVSKCSWTWALLPLVSDRYFPHAVAAIDGSSCEFGSTYLDWEFNIWAVTSETVLAPILVHAQLIFFVR